MQNHHNLSRRETQIMDLLYAEGELTVNGIRERPRNLEGKAPPLPPERRKSDQNDCHG